MNAFDVIAIAFLGWCFIAGIVALFVAISAGKLRP